MVVRDGQGRERAIETVADWNVRRDHILAHFEEVAGKLPGGERRVPLEVNVVSTTREAAFVRKKITFATEPGDRVPAWLLVPNATPEQHGKHPAVLCLASDDRDRQGRARRARRQNPELAYARELAERGYVTIAPDYPNFGEYKIDVYEHGYASATMKAIWNNLRAVDLLCGTGRGRPERIGVIGHSLGGHNAIFTALFDPRIKAVVSSCGFNAFPFYYKGNIAGWSHQGYMPRLRSRYRARPQTSSLRLSRADRRPGPASVLHELAAPRRQFRGRGCADVLAAAAPGLRAPESGDRLVAVYPDAEHLSQSGPPNAYQLPRSFLDSMTAVDDVGSGRSLTKERNRA